MFEGLGFYLCPQLSKSAGGLSGDDAVRRVAKLTLLHGGCLLQELSAAAVDRIGLRTRRVFAIGDARSPYDMHRAAVTKHEADLADPRWRGEALAAIEGGASTGGGGRLRDVSAHVAPYELLFVRDMFIFSCVSANRLVDFTPFLISRSTIPMPLTTVDSATLLALGECPAAAAPGTSATLAAGSANVMLGMRAMRSGIAPQPLSIVGGTALRADLRTPNLARLQRPPSPMSSSSGAEQSLNSTARSESNDPLGDSYTQLPRRSPKLQPPQQLSPSSTKTATTTATSGRRAVGFASATVLPPTAVAAAADASHHDADECALVAAIEREILEVRGLLSAAGGPTLGKEHHAKLVDALRTLEHALSEVVDKHDVSVEPTHSRPENDKSFSSSSAAALPSTPSIAPSPSPERPQAASHPSSSFVPQHAQVTKPVPTIVLDAPPNRANDGGSHRRGQLQAAAAARGVVDAGSLSGLLESMRGTKSM